MASKWLSFVRGDTHSGVVKTGMKEGQKIKSVVFYRWAILPRGVDQAKGDDSCISRGGLDLSYDLFNTRLVTDSNRRRQDDVDEPQ